ncbi:response regulator [bacterium]|nr:response regulator [bacterium]
MVVDDSPDAADSLCQLLWIVDYEARAAYSGPAAVALADTFAPDVVVLDIEMPGEDGYALADRLCAQLAGRPVLVALTGRPHLEHRSRSRAFDHHFLKPVEPGVLLDVLDGLAGSSPG